MNGINKWLLFGFPLVICNAQSGLLQKTESTWELKQAVLLYERRFMMHRIIRRILVIITAFLMSIFCITVIAAGTKTWDLDVVGISIDIPDDYVVFTRDTRSNDPNLEKYGFTKKDMDEILQAGNSYLDAWDENINREIVVSMQVSSSTVNYDEVSESLLSAMKSVLEEQYSSAGATVLQSEVYKHRQTSFLRFNYETKENGTSVYHIQYFTVSGGKDISIILHLYSGRITTESESFFKDIIDSIELHEIPEQKPNTTTETLAFKYSDTITGASFTVPQNWTQFESTQEDNYVSVSFMSNTEIGLMIIYIGLDVWNSTPEYEKEGFSREDIDNSVMSKADLATAWGVRASDISTVTYNGKEFFRTITTENRELSNFDYTTKMTTLFRVENGKGYMFQFNSTSDSPYYKDYEALVSSLEEPATIGHETKPSNSVGSKTDNKPSTATAAASNNYDSRQKTNNRFNPSWVVITLIDIAITLIIHPVPLWIYRYAIKKRPVAPKKAKRIVIVDAIIVFVIWMVIVVIKDGSAISFAALLLWSRISYTSLSKGYAIGLDYHISINKCLLPGGYGDAETFKHDGRIYDRKKYIALEKEALLKLEKKPLLDGYMTLTEENAYTPLHGLKAANYEAYKQAIIQHPDFQGTMLQRELQKESLKKTTEISNNTKHSEHENGTEQYTSMKQPKIKFCRRCGSELQPESDCCPHCGTPIIKEE